MSIKPIIQGRNFIETLILSLTQYEISTPSLEVKESVTKKLEEEICALSYSIPFIKNFYHQTIYKIIEEMFPDIAKPEFKTCFAYDEVLDWARRHRTEIFKERNEILTIRDVERELRALTIKIIRTAIMAVVYKSSLVSVKA